MESEFHSDAGIWPFFPLISVSFLRYYRDCNGKSKKSHAQAFSVDEITISFPDEIYVYVENALKVWRRNGDNEDDDDDNSGHGSGGADIRFVFVHFVHAYTFKLW